MKKAIFWMAAIALLAGCAKEQDTKEEVKNGKTYTVTASVDNPETRTIAGRYLDEGTNTYKYAFTWEENERIAVVPTDANTQLAFRLVDAELGTFSYEAEADEPEYTNFGIAVTPANALESEEPSLTDFDICFSGSYVQESSNSIMVAGSPSIGADGNWKFQFKHIAALVKVTYKNVPAGTQAMVFTADQNIAGTFHFNQATDIVAEHDALNMTLADSPKEAWVMFGEEPETTLESVDFYLPIPTGDYKTFMVYLLDENFEPIEGSEETFSATASFTLNRGDVVACPVITLPAVVAPIGTILLQETFEDFASADTPEAPGTHTIIYGGAEVAYSCIEGGTTTKIYAEALAGGESPELLVSKGNGEFSITGIPSGNNTELTVSWNSNNDNIILSSKDENVTIGAIDSPVAKFYQAIVTLAPGTASFDLSFKNPVTDSNGRLDNIKVIAGDALLKRVATPTFSHPSGEVDKDTEVTISTTTEGATIYYTDDDSEFTVDDWTEGSTVTISEAKTIKAVAVKEGMLDSDIASATYTLTGDINYATLESSNVELIAGTNGSVASVDGKDAIKVGTNNKGGDMSVKVPAGTVKLHLHAAAWNGVSGLSLNISGATVNPTSIALAADSGISNNSPFTLNGNPEDYYFVIALSQINQETTIKFTSSTTKRFVVWGVNAEVDSRSDAPISWTSDTGSATWTSTEGMSLSLPTLTNDEELPVSYASSAPNVATIANDGTLTFLAPGETVISATFVGTASSEYKTTTVTYTLTYSDNRETVATPVISSESVPDGNGVQVTITCETSGAAIYYTLDGTDPTDESTEYAGAFTLTESKTVKAIALKTNYKPSAIASASCTVGETTIKYIFTAKDWKATVDGNAANWTSGKDGAGFSNNGIQVTTSATGANGTSPVSFNNVTKIVCTYNTNKSAGAGSIDAKIGDNSATSNSVGFSGSANGTTANFTTQFSYATPQSGKLKLTVNTTTNSIYLVSVEITTSN